MLGIHPASSKRLRLLQGGLAPARKRAYKLPVRGVHWLRKTGLILAVLALALLVAGCDRCGDWYSPFENPFKPAPRSCHDGPQPH